MRSRSATRRGRKSSPATFRSRSSSIRAWSRSTSACSRTEPSRRRPIPNACAPRSPERRPKASTPSRSYSCTPTAIRRTSAWSAQDRARSRICPSLGKPCRFGSHQARRARRYDGGRRLSVADPRPLCRPSVARSRRRAHGRSGHVHDVVGRPDVGEALRRQGCDPVRTCRGRGGDGADWRQRRVQARHRLRHGRHFDRRRPFRWRIRARVRDRSRGRQDARADDEDSHRRRRRRLDPVIRRRALSRRPGFRRRRSRPRLLIVAAVRSRSPTPT